LELETNRKRIGVYVDEIGKKWKVEFLLRDSEQELKDKKERNLIGERFRTKEKMSIRNNLHVLGEENSFCFLNLHTGKGNCIQKKHTTFKMSRNMI
jgi:hypothetical protein